MSIYKKEINETPEKIDILLGIIDFDTAKKLVSTGEEEYNKRVGIIKQYQKEKIFYFFTENLKNVLRV